MNGGTYSEALKVGFNEEQAAFMMRLAVETHNETLEAVEQIAKIRRDEARHRRIEKTKLYGAIGLTLAFAVVVGWFISKACA